MNLDILNQHNDRAYPLLSSLVVPRPIAWVTTLNPDQSVNAAPFSFFNLIGDSPPMVMFCPGNRHDDTPKDTVINCKKNQEFVINLVPPELAQAMVDTSASLDYGVSETRAANLATVASATIATPRIQACPVALECKLHQVIEIGENRMVLGLITNLYVDDSLIDPTSLRIRHTDWAPVGRMASPDWYCQTHHSYQISHPS